MPQNDRISYETLGFNRFMVKSLTSNPLATNASNANASANTIALDRTSIEGALGDKFTIGRLILNGVDGRIELMNEDMSECEGWIGDLSNS